MTWSLTSYNPPAGKDFEDGFHTTDDEEDCIYLVHAVSGRVEDDECEIRIESKDVAYYILKDGESLKITTLGPDGANDKYLTIPLPPMKGELYEMCSQLTAVPYQREGVTHVRVTETLGGKQFHWTTCKDDENKSLEDDYKVAAKVERARAKKKFLRAKRAYEKAAEEYKAKRARLQ